MNGEYFKTLGDSKKAAVLSAILLWCFKNYYAKTIKYGFRRVLDEVNYLK